MKNYKFLIPILLIVMFAGSIYMLSDQKASELRMYNETLEKARDYREQDIQIDAEEYYMQALSQKPSIDLYVEIGKFYLEGGQERKAVDWGEEILAAYPNEAAGYEYQMAIYNAREDYVACYELADTFSKRGLQSQSIDEILDGIEYTFYFNGEYDDAGIYSGGLSPIQIAGKWGYVNLAGNKVIDATYSYAGPFIADLAPVVDSNGNAYFIDPEGNKKHVVLGVEKIARLGLIEDGLFSLYDGEKWYFYNTNDEMIFGGFDDVSAIGNGIAAVQKDGKWSLVDRTGADLTGKTYEAVAMDEKQVIFRNDRLFVSNGSGYQMIASSGEVVGGDHYDAVHIFNDTTYAAVKVNGKWGFVDQKGNVIITPQYEDARSFSNGFAAVKQKGLWGFINLEGEMVISPQFDDARDFNSDGCVFILNGSEWNLLRLYKSNH